MSDYSFRGFSREFLLYAQTRLRCRLSRQLGQGDYERLIGTEPDHIASVLSEGSYAEEVRRLGLAIGGERLIRAMAREKIAAELKVLRGICMPCKPAMDWIDGYRWKYDLSRLRIAFRARRAGGDAPEGTLTPLANLPQSAYQALIDAKNDSEYEEALRPFQGSPYYKTLSKLSLNALPVCDELETMLTHDFYRGVLGSMARKVGDDKPAGNFLLGEIGYINICTLLSAKVSGVSPEVAVAQVIREGKWASEERVRELAAAPDADRMMELLRRFFGSGRFAKMDAGPSPDFTAVERAASRALYACARAALRAGIPTPACLPGYIVCLETEGRNLWSLAAASGADFTKEEVRSMLVA